MKGYNEVGQMKKRFRSIVRSLAGFVMRTQKDHVGAYAAQAAYFIILSFIPIMLFLMTLVQYTPLTYNAVREAIISFLPKEIQAFVLGIVAEVFSKSGAVLPVTLMTALWSAAKGMQALTNGLNTIYHVKETRNWLITRLWSVFYTVLFIFALMGSLILLVFGNSIQHTLMKYIPFLGMIVGRFLGARNFLAFIVLVFVFLFLYKVLPNRRASLKSQLPGAVLTAIAWSVFSFGFSIYFTFFPNFTNMYGSLTAIILIMLWMYICMNIVLYGAEINAYYESEFRQAQVFARELFDREEEDLKDREEDLREDLKRDIKERQKEFRNDWKEREDRQKKGK